MASSFLVRPGTFGSQKIRALPRMIRRDAVSAPDELASEPGLIPCDVLHDGPAPALDGDAWHEVRARWLTEAPEAAFEETRASLAAFDRTVTQPGRHDEIVLWFEHDLFDQLL